LVDRAMRHKYITFYVASQPWADRATLE
jgi:hypothetical protein